MLALALATPATVIRGGGSQITVISFDGVDDAVEATAFTISDSTFAFSFVYSSSGEMQVFSVSDGSVVLGATLNTSLDVTPGNEADFVVTLYTPIGGVLQSVRWAGLVDGNNYRLHATVASSGLTFTSSSLTGTGATSGGTGRSRADLTAPAVGKLRFGRRVEGSVPYAGPVWDASVSGLHAWSLRGNSGAALEDTIGSNDFTALGGPGTEVISE